MKEVDINELTHVIGGATTVATRNLDTQTAVLLSRLSSDIKDLARPQTTAAQLMPMMMVAMMMRR